MKDEYLRCLLNTLNSEQNSDKYCLSDEYVSMLKVRIEERSQIIKELQSKLGIKEE